MTVAASPSPLARAWTARWPFAAELALFLALNVAYEWLRDLVAVESITRPLRNANQIVDAERALGLFVEPDIHGWAQSVPVAEFLTTWTYTLAHTTGFVAMFLWVWFHRREHFPFFRNWFWLTNGIAILGYWLYPLAPPRLSGMPGFADPTKESLELGGALSWFQPFRNEFAAMPSMHVGYTILFAMALIMMLSSPWRWLALLWPAGMLYVVMATANHWWLDGVGGAVCVVAALLLVSRLASPDLLRPWQRAAP